MPLAFPVAPRCHGSRTDSNCRGSPVRFGLPARQLQHRHEFLDVDRSSCHCGTSGEKQRTTRNAVNGRGGGGRGGNCRKPLACVLVEAR
ncbi:unnamed protein product [Lampetra planeri]